MKFHFDKIKGRQNNFELFSDLFVFTNEATILSGFSGVVWAQGSGPYRVKLTCRGVDC